jgi:hypothetical protein
MQPQLVDTRSEKNASGTIKQCLHVDVNSRADTPGWRDKALNTESYRLILMWPDNKQATRNPKKSMNG